MPPRRFFPCLALLAAAALAPLAATAAASRAGQDPPPPDFLASLSKPPGNVAETRHLTIRVSSSAAAAAPGDRVTLFLDVAPKPRMHVYSPDQKGYIPISVTLDANPAIRARPPRFPASERYFFAPLSETQRVFSRPFRIQQEVTVARPAAGRTAQAGPLVIKGTVRYQACDEAICYLPQDVPVSWTLAITPREG